MDPTANLADQKRLAERMLRDFADTGRVLPEDAERLAELVLALDEWLRRGGFLPLVWAEAASKEERRAEALARRAPGGEGG